MTDQGRKFCAYAGSSATPRVDATRDIAIARLSTSLMRRDIDVRPLQILIDDSAQHRGRVRDADERLAHDLLHTDGPMRSKAVIAWHDDYEGFFGHSLERQISHVGSGRRNARSSLPRMRAAARSGEYWLQTVTSILGNSSRRMRIASGASPSLARSRSRGQRSASPVGQPGEPLRSRVHLGQRQPGMVEKGLACGGQLDATNAARQQLGPDLVLQVANLPAQRRLGGVDRSSAAVVRLPSSTTATK